MPNKEGATYRQLFQTLKNYVPGLNPRTCIIDFETGSKVAIEAEFPNAELKGCFFHLSQSVYRNAQQRGLQNAYIEDEETRMRIKNLCSLAFLPANAVIPTFEQLQDTIEDTENEALISLYSYFEHTYIGRQTRRRRLAAQFPVEMWNIRTQTIGGIPRTNNKIEGWHSILQTQFDGIHPSMWKFFTGIQREQQLVNANVLQFEAGHDPPRPPKRYEDVNRRLTTLIQRHENEEIEIPEFLRGVNYNINLNV